MTDTLPNNKVAWAALVAALIGAVALIDGLQWLVALSGLAALLTLVVAWQQRLGKALLGALLAAALLALLQLWLPPMARWAGELLALSLLVMVGVAAAVGGEWQSGNRSFRRLVVLAMWLAYATALATRFAVTSGSPQAQQIEQVAVLLLGVVLFAGMHRALTRQYQPLVRRLAMAASIGFAVVAALVFWPLLTGTVANPTARLIATASEWLLLGALLMSVLRLPNKLSPEAARALAAARSAEKAPPAAWRVRLKDYLVIMKVTVSSLLLVTALGGMVIAARGWPGWPLVGWVLLGGLLSVGGAGAFNHFLDRDLDINMGRTSLRPLPAGRMSAAHVLTVGVVCSLLQFAIYWFKVNPISAWLSTAGLLYYVVIYTMWLKRSTTQNIVIGGAAGAFPPLVGWAAVTGDLSFGAWMLFAIIFMWTPPHFWALALMRREDYARAGVPMLPVVRGDAHTRVQIIIYTVVMALMTLVMVPLGLMGWLYLIGALLLNARFLMDAIQLHRAPSNQSALRLYKYSLLYLALLFLAMAVDRVVLG